MIQVRPASAHDAEAIALLVGQLGYPSSTAAVEARLDRLSADANVAVLVADEHGTVVGLATFHLIPVVHEDRPRGQLTALVVAESTRGRGIGSTLVRHVEQLAARRGVARLLVTTANHRTQTHEFYDRLGYEWTGRRYAKRLEPLPR